VVLFKHIKYLNIDPDQLSAVIFYNLFCDIVNPSVDLKNIKN